MMVPISLVITEELARIGFDLSGSQYSIRSNSMNDRDTHSSTNITDNEANKLNLVRFR